MTQTPFVGAPMGAIWGFDPTTGLWLPIQVGPRQTGPTGEEYAPMMVQTTGTASIVAADGAITTLGFENDPTVTNAATNATLISFTRGIVSLLSGVVAVKAQTTSGGGTKDFHLVSAASTNATNVKASSGQVYGYEIYNTNAAVRYVKLFNKSTAPTPGTDTPFRTIGVPPNGRAFFHSTTGIAFNTGIGFAMVTGIADLDATAVGLSDLVIDLDWI